MQRGQTEDDGLGGGGGGVAAAVESWVQLCRAAVQGVQTVQYRYRVYRVFSTDTECTVTGCSVSVYSALPHRSRSQAGAGSRETAAGVSRAAGDHCTQAPGRQQPHNKFFFVIYKIFLIEQKTFNEIFFHQYNKIFLLLTIICDRDSQLIY